MTLANNPLEVFFDLVPTGAILYAPIMDATGDVVDFAFVRLNPAAQRLLGLPAQPTATFREQYPHSVPTGIFAQYRAAYLTGQASTYDVPYAGDGLNTYFRLVAQRSGELLVVNFTDLADLPYVAMQASLRESQARTQQATAEAEAARADMVRAFAQAPVGFALFRGPHHIVEFINAETAAILGRPVTSLLGKPVFEAIPDMHGQGLEALMDSTLQHGTTHQLQEVPVALNRAHTQRPMLGYFNSCYQPQHSSEGHITGVVCLVNEVTEQVLARQQVERLNQELEARVAERTTEAQAARLDAEHPPAWQFRYRTCSP